VATGQAYPNAAAPLGRSQAPDAMVDSAVMARCFAVPTLTTQPQVS
jgi:hypothetical protein